MRRAYFLRLTRKLQRITLEIAMIYDRLRYVMMPKNTYRIAKLFRDPCNCIPYLHLVPDLGKNYYSNKAVLI